jgi:hypothetical protein
MKLKVLVLGFYDRQNLGDDSIKDALCVFFKNICRKNSAIIIDYKIVSTDDVESIPRDVDILIVGGGDLINDYFMTKIFKLVKNFHNPIYAFGIGIPYPELIDKGYLDIFDLIIHRTASQHKKLIDRYGKNNVFFAPDLTNLFLIHNDPFERMFNDFDFNFSSSVNSLAHINSKNRKDIGIFLSRAIYNPNDNISYDNILNNLASLITYISQKKKISFVGKLLKKDPDYAYNIYIIPMNTSNNSNEDDRIINRQVYNKITCMQPLSNVHLVETPIDMKYFNNLDLAICMKYHAHVFSIIKGIPFLSINCTSKVKDLIHQLNDFSKSECSCNNNIEMIVNPETLHPLNFNLTDAISAFDSIIKNYIQERNRILKFSEENKKVMSQIELIMSNSLIYKPMNIIQKIKDSSIINERYVWKICKKVFEHVCNYANMDYSLYIDSKTNELMFLNFVKTPLMADVTYSIPSEHKPHVPGQLLALEHKIENLFSGERGFIDDATNESSISEITDNEIYQDAYSKNSEKEKECKECEGDNRYFTDKEMDMIVDITIFTLFGKKNTEYNYGLRKQMFLEEYNFFESIKWLLDDYYKNNYEEAIDLFMKICESTVPIEQRILDMTYFGDNEIKGYHRSGWEYIMDHLKKYDGGDIILVDYVDKTFGWNREFNASLKKLPIKDKKWIGFIHHTDLKNYNKNNLSAIISNSNKHFIESLPTCLCLIVLSYTLKRQVEQKLFLLDGVDTKHIKVLAIYHPTELVNKSKCFSFKAFVANERKKIVQIGAWMRDTYAIYKLDLTECVLQIQKCILTGKDMDNYYLDNEKFKKLLKDLLKQDQVYEGDEENYNNHNNHGMCRDDFIDLNNCNKFIVGIVNLLLEERKSVQVIEHLNNEGYDKLLRENIVFLKLLDASAVNTLIECIARNTPIYVNKLPAIVEYLGEDYNLYYADNDDCMEKINYEDIKKAHKYLKNMDKSFLSVNNFRYTLLNEVGKLCNA